MADAPEVAHGGQDLVVSPFIASILGDVSLHLGASTRALPASWKAHTDSRGRAFYSNASTGQKSVSFPDTAASSLAPPSEVDRLRGDLASANEAVETLTAALAGAATAPPAAPASSGLDALRAEHAAALRKAADERAAEMEAVTSFHDAQLRGQTEDAAARIAALEAERDDALKAAALAAASAADARAAAFAERKTSAASNETALLLPSQIASLEGQVRTLTASLLAAEDRAAAAQSILATCRIELETARPALAAARAESADLRQKLADANGAAALSAAAAADADRGRERVVAEATTSRREADEARLALRALQAENATAQTAVLLVEVQQQAAGLAEALTALQAKGETDALAWDAARSALESAGTAAVSDATAWRRAYDGLQAGLAEAGACLDGVEAALNAGPAAGSPSVAVPLTVGDGSAGPSSLVGAPLDPSVLRVRLTTMVDLAAALTARMALSDQTVRELMARVGEMGGERDMRESALRAARLQLAARKDADAAGEATSGAELRAAKLEAAAARARERKALVLVGSLRTELQAAQGAREAAEGVCEELRVQFAALEEHLGAIAEEDGAAVGMQVGVNPAPASVHWQDAEPPKPKPMPPRKPGPPSASPAAPRLPAVEPDNRGASAPADVATPRPSLERVEVNVGETPGTTMESSRRTSGSFSALSSSDVTADVPCTKPPSLLSRLTGSIRSMSLEGAEESGPSTPGLSRAYTDGAQVGEGAKGPAPHKRSTGEDTPSRRSESARRLGKKGAALSAETPPRYRG